jgi:hypothetical protein
MEVHPFARGMQEDMAREVRSTMPKFIVYVNVFTSWLRKPASEGWIFSWLQEFLFQDYEMVGMVDIPTGNAVRYRWGTEAASAAGSSSYSLAVFQRRQEAETSLPTSSR